jgi:hypothetical protein
MSISQAGTFSGGSATKPSVNDTFYVWQAQAVDVAAGSLSGAGNCFPSVLTNGSVASTAAADLTVNASSIPRNNFQYYCEFKPVNATQNSIISTARNATGTNSFQMSVSTDFNELSVLDTVNSTGKAATITSLVWSDDARYKLCLTKSADSGLIIEVAGYDAVTNATDTASYTTDLITVFLGQDNAAGNQINGVLSNVKWSYISGSSPRTLEQMETLGVTLESITATRNYPLITDRVDDINGDTMTYARANNASVQKDSGVVEDLTANNEKDTGSGILIEESHTNLAGRSRQFNTLWVTSRSSVTADQETAPNGESEADQLTHTVTGAAYIYQLVGTSASTTYTLSAYVKAGTATQASLLLGESGQNNYVSGAKTDLTDGTIFNTPTTVGDYTFVDEGVEAASNGWYRIWMTVTTGAQLSSANSTPRINLAGSSVGEYFYLWQADLVQLAGLMSPVETATDSSAVSAADDLTVNASSVPTNDFSFYMEANCTATPSAGMIAVDLDDGTNGFIIDINSSGNWELTVKKNSTNYVLASPVAPTVGTTSELLVRMSSTKGISFEVDGITVYNNNTDNFSAGLSATSYLGSNGSANYINAVIDNIKWCGSADTYISQLRSL